MLWYLFTYDPPRKIQAETPSYEQDLGYEAEGAYTEPATTFADRSGAAYPSENRYSDYNNNSSYPSGTGRDYTSASSSTYDQTQPNYQYEQNQNTYEQPITAPKQTERTGIFGGLFGSSTKTQEPERLYERPETEFDQQQTVKKYPKREDYPAASRNSSFETRQEPYDYIPYVKEDYTTPEPVRRKANKPAPPPSPNYSGVRYIQKKYSRDGQIGTYKGPMLNGKPHGFAVFRYDNGNMYVGEYRNGARNGYGNSIFKKDNRVQLRKYVNGKQTLAKNIYGIVYLSIRFVNGPGKSGTYHGPTKNKKPHGYGYFKYDNGDIYIGTYRNGQRDGAGNSIFSNSGYIETRKYKNGKRID